MTVSCEQCGGTGVCRTCYVPRRRNAQTRQVAGQNTASAQEKRARYSGELRQRIAELEAKIQRKEFDLSLMRLKGTDVSSNGTYSIYLQELYGCQTELTKLRLQLTELGNL